MAKVRERILDSLTRNAPPLRSLLILTQDIRLGRRLADIMEVPSILLDVSLDASITRLADHPLIRNASHVIELYHPTLANSIYAKALRSLLLDRGKSVLSLWNWDERYLADEFWGDLEYPAIASAAAALARRMEKASTVRVTSDLGTDISFSVAGRSWIVADGYCAPGKLAQLPDGEIYTCPVEESFYGRIVIDGTISRLWLPDKPVALRFEAGRMVEADPRFEQWLWSNAGGVDMIGEFAIGMNPMVHGPYANISVDEKEAGSVHFALGDSYRLGLTESVYHVDFVVRNPVITVDGTVLKDYLPAVQPQKGGAVAVSL